MNLADRHLSTVYDSELDALVTRLMAFGGRCEAQTRSAGAALESLDADLAEQVIADEVRINQLELEIDRSLAGVLARRQPAARDLRLLMAVSRTLSNLERIGDEAVKMARTARAFALRRPMRAGSFLPRIHAGAGLAAQALHQALDAFARVDMDAAVTVLRNDEALDHWFDDFSGDLAAEIAGDPAISHDAFALLLAAKAGERIGDHAKNIAELVIYASRGDDVRHMAVGEVALLVA